MTEHNHNETETAASKPGKISLQEAMKRKLAEKKQAQTNQHSFANQKSGNQMMKSQQTKKPNNQRRRTGV
ncbi:hypothetical protein [Brevibacillus sp. H7]|uniref:hypothetical protein n=1 Tax=Brevibacillus sp. H7 TaxID=3349138 RepID=UPI00381CFC6A